VSGFSSRIRSTETRAKPRIAYIVSGLPKYRPARRTALIPIRPCLQDCAREPNNAPRHCSALSACRPSPELVASHKASLETSGKTIDLQVESGERLAFARYEYISLALSRILSLTLFELGPAIVGDPLIDIIDTRVSEYVADVLGATPCVEVDQSVSRLFLSHLP